MSGFCGFTGAIENSNAIVASMMEKIKHRGPDSFGVYVNNEVAIGFRRLIIREDHDGEQPMYNEDGSIAAVLDGAIDNGAELRAELCDLGHVIDDGDDRAVLPHLYEQYGKGLIHRLQGMFAFVIYDSKQNVLFAARDRFGIKPFYYSLVEGNLLFASEIKSFIPHPGFTAELNEHALEHYLTFQYSVLPATFFKGVYTLMPAHYLIFKEGSLELESYWEPSFEPHPISLEEAAVKIENAVLNAIEKIRVSNFAAGSFLSGGVDSGFVAACFKSEKTFTVGFAYDGYNEVEYAKNLSEKIGLTNISKIISSEEYFHSLPIIQYHMDEPLADPAAVAFYFACQVASEHVKVALSGEGADEFFGGYIIYSDPLKLQKISFLPMPLRRFLSRLMTKLPFSIKGKDYFIRAGKTVEERFIGNAKIFSKAEREDILKSFCEKAPESITKPFYDKAKIHDDITKMQYIDINLWLVGDILLQAGKMSMAHSLEVLMPYMDKEVFNIAMKLPTDLRVTKLGTKLAFRKAAAKHLPEQVANKKKLGFPVPIRIWLKEEKYYHFAKKYFTNDIAQKYFHPDKLLQLLDDHKYGKVDNSRKIWTVLSFLIWHEQYF